MPLTNRVNFQEFIIRLKHPVVRGSSPRGGPLTAFADDFEQLSQ